MFFEMTVALFVVDHEKYAQYRAEIAPLLLSLNLTRFSRLIL